MPATKPALFSSVFKMKCPNCRKGNMFCTPHIFPLGRLLEMPDRCPNCNQKYELEVGFYYGTGYVSYGLSLGVLAIVFILYTLIFGLSYKDNSVFYALGAAVSLTLLLQPWLMRMSRVLYLYMFVQYGKGSRMKTHHH
ncbi:MAG: DUF983 domain-containing protein [Bacteroidetes bacterium]|nr:DUF983 domain-containing protein [Bacteroidota bacterium]MBS1741063.1 DUF983 domain-containing protein [Bacteroidota bacterium]